MIETETYYWIGNALISGQRVEFLTHGIISHFKDLNQDKEFKNLTPRMFLDNTNEAQKTRKQTLGQIFRILKQNDSLAIVESLNDYLLKRNLLVHGLWREYFRDNYKSDEHSNGIQFCKDFIDKSAKMENFYKGLLYAMVKHVSSISQVEIPQSLGKFENKYSYFINCLNHKKLF